MAKTVRGHDIAGRKLVVASEGRKYFFTNQSDFTINHGLNAEIQPTIYGFKDGKDVIINGGVEKVSLNSARFCLAGPMSGYVLIKPL